MNEKILNKFSIQKILSCSVGFGKTYTLCRRYINGLCPEYERYNIIEMMEKLLENPKNDLGD